MRLTNERQDKYGRVVATVFSGSQNVNFAMIESGYAWHYERYSNNKQYAAAQKLAQSQRRGLWADKGKIIKPEQWRHRYKLSQKKCSDCLIAYRSLPLSPFSLD